MAPFVVDVQLAIWSVGILLAGGVLYGDVRARLKGIESMIGNGKPGVFVKRDELDPEKVVQMEEFEQLRTAVLGKPFGVASHLQQLETRVSVQSAALSRLDPGFADRLRRNEH
jgi:hypothetical protein